MVEHIKEKMHNRGYTYSFESRNGEETSSITFSYICNSPNPNARFPIPIYNVTVYPNTEEFEFSYYLGNSINRLTTPRCGSFFNDDHFDRLAIKFEHDAAILDKYNK